MKRKKAKAKSGKTKVATSLFDYTPGVNVEPPSDPKVVKQLAKDCSALTSRLKPLDSDSRLAIAHQLAREVNASTDLFNCVIFERGKEPEQTVDMFRVKNRELDLF